MNIKDLKPGDTVKLATEHGLAVVGCAYRECDNVTPDTLFTVMVVVYDALTQLPSGIHKDSGIMIRIKGKEQPGLWPYYIWNADRFVKV